MTNNNKDPMGTAIADYQKNGIAGRLRVFSPNFDEDEIPVDTLFRDFQEMPSLEQKALQMAKGQILDVGAGAGCHSIALQEMGKSVTAIDISELSVQTMKARGVEDAQLKDFWLVDSQYDTILMLMNGIGIVGSIKQMPRFFTHLDKILKPEGELIVDSTDIKYVFEDDNGNVDLPKGYAYYDNLGNNTYYGELEYQMQYKRIKGSLFPWLYIDFDTLDKLASANGFQAQIVEQNDNYQYLARIARIDNRSAK